MAISGPGTVPGSPRFPSAGGAGAVVPATCTVTQGPFRLLLVLQFGQEKSQAKLKLSRMLWSLKYLPKPNEQQANSKHMLEKKVLAKCQIIEGGKGWLRE